MVRKGLLTIVAAAPLVIAGCLKTQGSLPRSGWIYNQHETTASLPMDEPDVLPRTFYAAGQFHEEQGNLREAARQYRKAIAVGHQYVHAYYRMAVVLSRLGEHEGAVEALGQAVALKPKIAALRNDLGYELMAVGRWADATVELERSIDLAPDYRRPYVNLGMALSKMGRFDEARTAFAQVLQEPDALYNMGLMYRGQGRYADAVDSFFAVLRLNPDFSAAAKQLESLQSVVAVVETTEPAVATAVVGPVVETDRVAERATVDSRDASEDVPREAEQERVADLPSSPDVLDERETAEIQAGGSVELVTGSGSMADMTDPVPVVLQEEPPSSDAVASTAQPPVEAAEDAVALQGPTQVDVPAESTIALTEPVAIEEPSEPFRKDQAEPIEVAMFDDGDPCRDDSDDWIVALGLERPYVFDSGVVTGAMTRTTSATDAVASAEPAPIENAMELEEPIATQPKKETPAVAAPAVERPADVATADTRIAEDSIPVEAAKDGATARVTMSATIVDADDPDCEPDAADETVLMAREAVVISLAGPTYDCEMEDVPLVCTVDENYGLIDAPTASFDRHAMLTVLEMELEALRAEIDCWEESLPQPRRFVRPVVTMAAIVIRDDEPLDELFDEFPEEPRYVCEAVEEVVCMVESAPVLDVEALQVTVDGIAMLRVLALELADVRNEIDCWEMVLGDLQMPVFVKATVATADSAATPAGSLAVEAAVKPVGTVMVAATGRPAIEAAPIHAASVLADLESELGDVRSEIDCWMRALEEAARVAASDRTARDDRQKTAHASPIGKKTQGGDAPAAAVIEQVDEPLAFAPTLPARDIVNSVLLPLMGTSTLDPLLVWINGMPVADATSDCGVGRTDVAPMVAPMWMTPMTGPMANVLSASFGKGAIRLIDGAYLVAEVWEDPADRFVAMMPQAVGDARPFDPTISSGEYGWMAHFTEIEDLVAIVANQNQCLSDIELRATWSAELLGPGSAVVAPDFGLFADPDLLEEALIGRGAEHHRATQRDTDVGEGKPTLVRPVAFRSGHDQLSMSRHR